MTLREEILCLLDSVELQQYLLTHPDKLQVRDYADLVAGAPVSLVQKKEILERPTSLHYTGQGFIPVSFRQNVNLWRNCQISFMLTRISGKLFWKWNGIWVLHNLAKQTHCNVENLKQEVYWGQVFGPAFPMSDYRKQIFIIWRRNG